MRASLLGFSVPPPPQGVGSTAPPPVRTCDRHASLSADRSSFVARLVQTWEFSTCKRCSFTRFATFISLVMTLLHRETSKHCVIMETEWVPLASAVCCENVFFYFFFYLDWPGPNEKTIHVSVHLAPMILNDVFSHQASDWNGLNCQKLTNSQRPCLCYTLIK